jgi:hypothetical protein
MAAISWDLAGRAGEMARLMREGSPIPANPIDLIPAGDSIWDDLTFDIADLDFGGEPDF